jgi:glycosyltransferase involved in cell wall biosynthesis
MPLPTPSISIVTPSFNQGQFLEETMRSVLDQNYPNLEYLVMDGGSTDGSVDIIRRHADRLSYWTSGKDGGHYAAIAEGFRRSSGEIMAWINSDDKYLPWTFSVVGEIFAAHPKLQWLTTAYPLIWDRHGRAVACGYAGGFNHRTFLAGANLPAGRWHVGPWIQQESTFWRRSLWDRAGGTLDNSSIAGDLELWSRFFRLAPLVAATVPLSGFRAHGDQVSVGRRGEYIAAGEEVLRRAGGGRAGVPRRLLRAALHHGFGGRPLNKLPQGLRRALVAGGLLFEAPVCERQGEAWALVDNYVF